ncbi:MAG: transcription antitermination factor NusB [Sporomusaceae bacterium]|nr:transcription antitermination factor NusB [Sporomusaceae bacterium]
MSRRKAREIALQTLFQLDFNEDIAITPAMEMAVNEYEVVSDKDKLYAERLIGGAKENLSSIDDLIARSAYDWRVERMPGVDRNIVRLAIYELHFGPDPVPPGVVINEAVELAKEYGTEDSSRFVNGVLGSLVKHKETP